MSFSDLWVAAAVAVVFTALCLGFAVVALLDSTTLTFTAGRSSTVDCGSPAFPNSMDDLGSTDDAANCAGQTSAAPALYAVLLAGAGLVAVAVTARRTSPERGPDRTPAGDQAAAGSD